MPQAALHRWRFFRAGGFDQPRIDSGADILALDSLDQKLWVVLGCPVKGLEFDRRTLELLDSDGDGRIRAGEILHAVAWLRTVLKDPEVLVAPGDDLPLSAIDRTTPEGARIYASAKSILANLGKPEAETIAPADTADTVHIFSQTHFNGDGIIPATAARDDADSVRLIEEMMSCLGSEMDRSGLPGVSQDIVDHFFAEAEAFTAWHAKAAQSPSHLPLGETTVAALKTLDHVQEKIQDYFLRCRLTAYDPKTAEALGAVPDTLSDIAILPLALPAAERALPLVREVNPAWEEALAEFRAAIVRPLRGEIEALSERDWKQLLAEIEPSRVWLAEKPQTRVESLSTVRLKEIVEGDLKARLNVLLAQDRALEAESAAIGEVDRLVRYRRDIHTLLNNFVSLSAFYSRRGKAVFQAGTLYLDGRSCDLCLRVDNPEKHAALATVSRIYLVYCACVRPGSGETMHIAAAITAGDSDQLTVGRNGIFYDRQGRDWDATIIKIIEHPISIRQAFWSPYKQLARMIGEAAEKFAAAKSKVVQVQMGASVDAAQKAAVASVVSPPAATPVAPPAFDAGRFAGIFAAIGLALGAIGTAIASVVTGFMGLSWWQMPMALGGLLLLVSGPSIILAAMKLRQRNLGPLLDANGWAINSRALINIPFGTALTAIGRLPDDAERSLIDPYAQKRFPWGRYVLLVFSVAVVIMAWRFGIIANLSQWVGR